MDVTWSDPTRQQACAEWLASLRDRHGLSPEALSPASADASFRRYLQVPATASPTGRYLVMDSPPQLENNAAFAHVAGLMAQAGLNVPRILDWHQPQGFLLLTDLGPDTLMSELAAEPEADHRARWQQCLDVLLPWQSQSLAQALPPYDRALLMRELQLFPDWYVGQHLGVTLTDAERQQWQTWFERIVTHNLQAPLVPVHRDFMPRNLMLPLDPAQPVLGVLDFQDAVWGPITYDVASLMRDAFISWDEEQVIDVTVRHWERLRPTGLIDGNGWSQDFGAFYEAVEWMGLQRHLKVAGIFARLTLRDGKPKYLADAPRFIHYIRSTAVRYRELTPLLRALDRLHGTVQEDSWVMGRG